MLADAGLVARSSCARQPRAGSGRPSWSATRSRCGSRSALARRRARRGARAGCRPTGRTSRTAVLIASVPFAHGHRLLARSPPSSRCGCRWAARRSPTRRAASRASPRCSRSWSRPTSASPPSSPARPWAPPSRWRSRSASRAGSCACARRSTARSGASSRCAAVPLGLTLAVAELYFRADTFILSLSRPAAEVGQYALAYRLYELLALLPAIVMTSVFPLLSRQLAHDRAAAERTLRATARAFVDARGAARRGRAGDRAGARAARRRRASSPPRPTRCGCCSAPRRSAYLSGLLRLRADRRRTRSARTLRLSLAALGRQPRAQRRARARATARPPRRRWRSAARRCCSRAAGCWCAAGSACDRRSPDCGAIALAAAVMAAAVWPLRERTPALTVPLGAVVYGAALCGARRDRPADAGDAARMRTSVLVVSAEPVGAAHGRPGDPRARARARARGACDVTLAAPRAERGADPRIAAARGRDGRRRGARRRRPRARRRRRAGAAAGGARAARARPRAARRRPLQPASSSRCSRASPGGRPRAQRRMHGRIVARTLALCAAADLVLCANERQRDLWIGGMALHGLIDAGRPTRATRRCARASWSCRSGCPDGPPPAPIGRAARGVPRDRRGRPRARVGRRRLGLARPGDPDARRRAAASAAGRAPTSSLLGLGRPGARGDAARRRAADGALAAAARAPGCSDTLVHVNDGWVPYAERGGWLAEADLGVTAHHDHLEARYAHRTRVLDYLWAGLPVVATRGDALAELVERERLGVTVPPERRGGLRRRVRAAARTATAPPRASGSPPSRRRCAGARSPRRSPPGARRRPRASGAAVQRSVVRRAGARAVPLGARRRRWPREGPRGGGPARGPAAAPGGAAPMRRLGRAELGGAGRARRAVAARARRAARPRAAR